MQNSNTNKNDAPEIEGLSAYYKHLIELRQRLIYALLPVIIGFLGLFNWAPDIFKIAVKPLHSLMPAGSQIVFHDVLGSFTVPIKLTFLLVVFLCLPWILYQIWAFVAPALYANEKRLVLPLTLVSYLFFVLGLLFAYFVVCPMIFHFIVAYNQKLSLPMLTDAQLYLSFIFDTLLMFGLVFELPVILLCLVYVNILTIEQLKGFRRYAIVICFVVAAIVTPPDPFSQIAMAVPMCLLYELGIILAKVLKAGAIKNNL